MVNIQEGKIYVNGEKTREIIKIDGEEIYYKTERGKQKQCLYTTFQDWLNDARRKSNTIYDYEILYIENGEECMYALKNSSKESAKDIAKKYKEMPNRSNVRLIEYKTTKKIVDL